MKNPTIVSKLLAPLAGVALLLGATQAEALDGGIDPKNMGKGDWIWSISISIAKLNNQVPGVTDIQSLMSYEKNQGMSYVIVKAGTGSTNYPSAGSPQFTSSVVTAAHNVGLKVFAYTRSYGTDLPGEIGMATNCLNLGADGWVIDAEGEWESSRLGTNGPSRAIQYCTAIKAAYPTRLLAHSPMPYVSLHSSFPYKEFGYYCDVVMPQDYWNYIGVTPTQMVSDMDSEWSTFYNSLGGTWTNAIKPLAPICQADNTNVPNSEISAFCNAVVNDATPVTPGGYKSINFWDAHEHSATQWPAIAAVVVGDSYGVPDVIVDNATATMVGTWTLGTSSADKYAADYRSKGQGTGTASFTFTPTITVAGNYKVYEWHPKGTNRTTNAPVTVNFDGGSTTVKVNQTLTGGSWVLLGTFPFKAGTAGNVVITDATPDAGMLVMADAVRFAYVIPVPPAATGLTATAVAGPQIGLNWTDNAIDEFDYIVARSTSAAGPFKDIVTLPADSTNYTDAKVAASTTYFYNVRSENHAGNSANSSQASATTDNSVADIIVDNPSATVVGSWSTGTAAGKFGADYRFKSQGTGSAYLQYTPEVFTSGDYNVYEWHPAGANRSTTVPYVISYNGGTVTTPVNEQLNGGAWNLLGTFNLAAGQTANVKITDGATDAGQTMADAIKFSFAIAPNAPSGLTATAAGTSQINLSWTDNSGNEDNFVVSRSSTSGGPYTDIATVAANATSYSNTGLAGGTTYYYVVRAVNVIGSSALTAQASATTTAGAPAAPSGLAATAASASQIDLSWTDNSSNETSFTVARSATAGGPYTDIATLGANATSYSNTGLSADTTYYYVVRASNVGGSSANSAEASANTLPNPPATPSGLIASVAGSTQVNLSWTDNSSNETGFVVARSATSGGSYTDIATVGANVASYSNSGLTANTTYYYVVRAINAGGASANSAETSATTLPNAPTAPSGLSATTVSASQINLSWADNSSNETSFIVGRSATSGGSYVDIATLAANSAGYSDAGLTPNTTYYYVVRARNSGGDSANSAQASGTTLPLPPASPTGLIAATVSASQIDLSWADNSANETSFVIARGTVSGGPFSDVATLGANVTSYSNTGLSANTTYYYVVRAANTGGSSANSAQAGATTLPLPPAAPSGLAASTVSGTQINLSWADNSANETSMIVARSTTAGGPYTDIATLAANTVSYSDTGLTAGTTYYYVVRAANAGGSSVNSAEANATTLPPAPSAPSALTATAYSSSQINLSWVDNSSNESGFVVARSATAGGPYTDIATVGANVTSYSNTGRTTNTTYYYVVRATNAGGTSANTAESSATTFREDLLIDNVSAVVVGSWSTGTSSTDKFGTDYRFKSPGTGSSYVMYSPYVATTGNYEVYEWHTQGSNRTTNAPHVISYNGGLVTNYVNQVVNGGKWNLIGTYNFAAGNTGNIKITDSFSGTNVIADAIKLVALPIAAAPSGLTATAASASQINLAWVDNSTNETGFVVGRSTTSGGPYTDIVTLGANVTSYNNTGLTSATTYYYVVRATATGGSSANSAQASATTLTTPPTAPSGLTATSAGTNQINLAWVDNSSNETGFIVARSTTSGGPYTDIVTVGANVTTYSNTGLASATTYYYVVRATNSGGSSANTAQASATTATVPPAAPSGLTATAASSSQINLAWVDNSSNETGFVVARSTTSGGPYTDVTTVGANVTSYNNTGLTASTTYYYVVRAINAGGNSANTAQASATTPVAVPTAPSALTATSISTTQINLAWVDNSSNETGFVVARSTTSGGPYTDVVTVGANVVAYSNTNLAPATTYYYVVRAINAGGSSANSAQASAMTASPAPNAPSGLTATAVSGSQINLSWIDNSSNESNFIIGRSTSNGGPYSDIATLGANVTSYSNTGLSVNTTYYYVVRSANGSGSSLNSAQASATTPNSAPAAPSALAATALTPTSIKLTWTDNSANETSFIVARSTTSGGPYTDVVTLAANTTSYTNSGLAVATTYYFVVRSSNAGGASANSAQASATTQSVADIIIDDTAATVTGTWSTGTSSTDKFGTDYRFKSAGTGTAFLTYTPTIGTAGNYKVYEWHPQGSNRTTAAPVVVTHSGVSVTVPINQQVNGGTWVLVGTYNFAVGTAGNVKITDNFTGSGLSVMADAIKFVYAP